MVELMKKYIDEHNASVQFIHLFNYVDELTNIMTKRYNIYDRVRYI